MVRLRGTPQQVERAILSTADRDGRQVIIDLPQDPGQAGKAQVRYLKGRLAGFNVRSSPKSGATEIRARALSDQTEAATVYVKHAAWNTVYVHEAALFPNSNYSVQIDASSRAFHRLARSRGRGLAAAIAFNV